MVAILSVGVCIVGELFSNIFSRKQKARNDTTPTGEAFGRDGLGLGLKSRNAGFSISLEDDTDDYDSGFEH